MMKKRITAVMLCLCAFLNAQTHLTLEQSRTLALENNSRVKNSELEVNAAREIKKEAATKYFPQVSATAIGMKAIDPLLEAKMKGGNLPVYDGNPANLSGATQFAYMPDVNLGMFNQLGLGYLNVLQPVYAGGKIKTGNRLTELNLEVKENQKKLSVNQVLLQTEQQYWQLIVIREKQKTLDNYLNFLDKLYLQVNNAYKNGLVIKNDLLKITIKQHELQVDKLQLENGRHLALMQLCQTIGISYSDDIILDADLEEFAAPQNYFVSNSEAMPRRAEYQMLQSAVTALELQTKLKKGDYLPALAVGASGYYLDQFQSGQNGALNGMAYASLSIPISDWWGGSHKIKEMRLMEVAAKNVLEDNKELLNLQMEKAWTDLNESEKKIQLVKSALEQAEENLKVNSQSYKNGLIQLSDLLEAQALKSDTENKYIEAKSQYKTALTIYLQVTAR